MQVYFIIGESKLVKLKKSDFINIKEPLCGSFLALQAADPGKIKQNYKYIIIDCRMSVSRHQQQDQAVYPQDLWISEYQ